MAGESVGRDSISRKQNRIYFTQQQEILFKRIILIGGKMADMLRTSDVRYFLGELAEELVEQWDNLISEFVLSVISRKRKTAKNK